MVYEKMECKSCGANLGEAAAHSTDGLVKCPYCGNAWTIPKEETDPAALSFLRMGEHELDVCKFDDAFSSFKRAAECDPAEPEAFFGMALAEFKVQYLKDEVADPPRLQPICHEISEKKFTEGKNYLKALSLATDAQKEEYARKGGEIDDIRTEFYALRQQGVYYDCFLCVKVTDGDGQERRTTQDSHEALRIYNHLKNRDLKPFYSEEEIKERTGTAYEALILYALYTSPCMLIICSDEEYLQTKWVKNEYMRFSKMIVHEEKDRDAITFVYKGRPIERLPGRDWKIQGIDLGKPDAYSRIEAYVDGFAARSAAGPADIKRKEYGAASYTKKNTQRQGVTKRKLAALGGGAVSVSDQSKLSVVSDLMARSDFDHAIRMLDDMIRENPSNGMAYFLRFLAENRCKDHEEFANMTRAARSYDSLEKAIAATGDYARRSTYYDALYRHIEKSCDLGAYNEYIVLPESEEEDIRELTELLYRKALEDMDEETFDAIIRTVTDSDDYIKKNYEFAALFEEQDALPYYKNILNADASEQEAAYHVFRIVHGGLASDEEEDEEEEEEENEDEEEEEYDEDELEFPDDEEEGREYIDEEDAARAADRTLFAFCSEESNASVMEEELFGFGFNRYANEQLFILCINGLGEGRTAEACRLFDFLLSMTPKDEDALYREEAVRFLDVLFGKGEIKTAQKYNELLLALDKFDHEAYFNRVLIKNGFSAPIALIRIADHLLEDEDYFLAVNSYAEKNAALGQKNRYLDINDTIVSVAKKVTDPDCMQFLLEKSRTAIDADVLTDRNKTLGIVNELFREESDRYLKAFLSEVRCSSCAQVYELRQDVSQNASLAAALKFAEAGEAKNASELRLLVATQAKTAEQNVKKDRTDKENAEKETRERAERETREKKERAASRRRERVAVAFLTAFRASPIVLAVLMVTLLIIAMTKSTGVYLYFLAMFNGNMAAVYGVGIVLILIPFLLMLPILILGWVVDVKGAYSNDFFMEYEGVINALRWVSFAVVWAITIICHGVGIAHWVEGNNESGKRYIGDMFYCEVKATRDNLAAIVDEQIIPVEGLSITYYSGAAENVVLPATYGGRSIVHIGIRAFEDSDLTSVEIPEGVLMIGESAFLDCESLETVTIPKSLLSISGLAFSNCTSLSDIYYDGTLEEWAKLARINLSTPYEGEVDRMWNFHSGNYTVHCTNGTVTKQKVVTYF